MKNFFFTSYVIWVVVRSGQFIGLQIKDKLGEEEGQKAVWEYYTPLPVKESRLHYKRINDAFLFPIIIKLTGDTGFKLRKEAMEIVKKWGCWFIRNSRSTYLRVSGFIGEPFLLPRYCTNRIILLEYARKMVHLQKFLSSRHKTRVTGEEFSLNLSFFSCQKTHVEKAVEKELQDLQLKPFNYARQCYDPYNKLKGLIPKVYEGHQLALEDFWANLQDSFEVREKYYHYLIVPQIRNFGIETKIPKKLYDDGILLDPMYKETGIDKRPLPPIRWSQQEVVDVIQFLKQ